MPLALREKECARCHASFMTRKAKTCGACRSPEAVIARRTSGDLSSREKQIADLVGLGKTNKEIAYNLGLTTGTVKEYLSSIFPKLHVTNRVELALRIRGLSF